MCNECEELKQALSYKEETIETLRGIIEIKQEIIDMMKDRLNETYGSKQKIHAPHLRVVR